jgi:hypothetical protein
MVDTFVPNSTGQNCVRNAPAGCRRRIWRKTRGQVVEIALTQMNRPHPPGKRGVCHRREHSDRHVSCMSSKTNVTGLKHTDVAAAL